MAKDKTGGSAFPVIEENCHDLRDYFAAHALIGLAAALKDHTQEGFNMIAKHAGQIADAQIAERDKEVRE